MTTSDEFRALDRSSRKQVLSKLHDDRIDLKKRGLKDSEIYKKLVDLIQALEDIHHSV